MIFFTSDTHYGHANIIRYSNRPFKSVDQMNEALINNWNRVVTNDDTVYHLGDFAFYSDPAKVTSILNRLNGTKIFIFGNHDKVMYTPEVRKLFKKMTHYDELSVPEKNAPRGHQKIVLLHYAMRVWNGSHRGAWQLYGHSHGSLPEEDGLLAFDVGVDCWNYAPVSYDQVKRKMGTKTFKPIDHHE